MARSSKRKLVYEAVVKPHALRPETTGKQPNEMCLIEKGTSANENQASIRFGSVVVRVAFPSKDEASRNIEAGQIALARAQASLVKPGVRVGPVKNVPLFRADPKNPGRIVRQLNGRSERGIFVQGVFKTG